MTTNDEIEECALMLHHEIEKLDKLQLAFASSLVKLAHLDLLMRLNQVTDKDIDLLSFVENFVQQQRANEKEAFVRDSTAPSGGINAG